MYFVSAVLLVAILPAASVILEAALATHGLSIMALVGKWYVFWACGVRLVLAGLRQVSQPCFTAAEIFNLDNVKAFRWCGRLDSGASRWERSGSARSSGRHG